MREKLIQCASVVLIAATIAGCAAQSVPRFVSAEAVMLKNSTSHLDALNTRHRSLTGQSDVDTDVALATAVGALAVGVIACHRLDTCGSRRSRNATLAVDLGVDATETTLMRRRVRRKSEAQVRHDFQKRLTFSSQQLATARAIRLQSRALVEPHTTELARMRSEFEAGEAVRSEFGAGKANAEGDAKELSAAVSVIRTSAASMKQIRTRSVALERTQAELENILKLVSGLQNDLKQEIQKDVKPWRLQSGRRRDEAVFTIRFRVFL